MGFSQNSTFGFGNKGVDSSGFLIAANEGLSVNGQIVQLGQTVAEAGDPALIDQSRELPFTSSGNILLSSQGTSTSTLSITIKPSSIAFRGQSIADFQTSTGTNRDIMLFNSGLVGVDNFGALNMQPTTGTNVGCGMALIPKGTGYLGAIKSQMTLYGTDVIADPVNFSGTAIRMSSTSFDIVTANNGTGTLLPISLFTGTNSFQLFLDTTGNVGINVGNAPAAKIHAAQSLTGSSSEPIFRLDPTWNTSGNPIGIFLNATNTASGATTLLMDLRLSSASKFKVDKNGVANMINAYIGNTSSSPTAKLHIAAGSTTASTAPIKLTSGSLMTTPEVGAIEFLTSKAYLTITTGTARKEFTLNDAALSTDRIPFTTTNGRLSTSSNLQYFDFAQQLVVTDQVSAAILLGGGNIAVNGGSTTVDAQYYINSDAALQMIIGIGASANPTSGYPNNAYIKYTNGTKLFIDSPEVNFTAQTGVYIGNQTTAPTAKLHIVGGTATAGTAPLKFTSGTNLTTAETGAMEYNGTNLFFTRTGTTRESVFTGNSGASAPTTTPGGTPTDFYGSGGTNYLSTPNSWAGVVIGGTTYKIPLYT